MKKLLSLLLFALIFNASAQDNIKGYLIDSENNTPISNAKISTKTNTTYSDKNGKFNSVRADTIKIQATGYYSKQVAIEQRSKITIALQSNPEELEAIHISAPNANRKLKNTAQRITIRTKKDLETGNSIEFAPILNAIPGVFMQSGALNTNRITIRGIGARNPFGTVGIRAFYEDIPLTDGNGASAIEDLELAALSRIEIHKGPATSSYGSGLGGAIVLIPEKKGFNHTSGAIQTTFGSYGLQRLGAKIQHSGNHAGVNINYSNTQQDGYRDNNNYERTTLTTTGIIAASDKNQWHMIGSYVDLKAFIPSSLNQNDYDKNPRKAAFTWGRAQGFEASKFGLLGVSWNHEYTSNLRQKTSLYTTFRKNDEPRPFNILQENSNILGIRTRMMGPFSKRKKVHWTLGGAWFGERATIATFENLYEDFPPETGSVQGEQISDFEERRAYYNLFAEVDYKFDPKWRIAIGINVNQTFFKIEKTLIPDTTDPNTTFNFEPLISPSLGVIYTPSADLRLFGRIAHGFNTPTTEETLMPDGVFNPNLQPETGWNFEMGSDFKMLNNKLRGSVSSYLLEVKNLLVNRRSSTDDFFAINAGETRHIGLEFDMNYHWIKTPNIQLQTTINGALNAFTFRDFVDEDNDFSGNRLTGTPTTVLHLGVALDSKKGYYGHLNSRYVSDIPADDANTTFGNAYTLLDAKLGYRDVLFKTLQFHLFLGIQNILDQKYAAQLQVNANSFGGNAPRYFYPGNPINFYSGINIIYPF